MRATSVEAQSDVMNAIPSGTSNRPSIPERKNSGRKLAMMMRVELRIGIRTSLDASKMTLIFGLRCSGGRL